MIPRGRAARIGSHVTRRLAALLALILWTGLAAAQGLDPAPGGLFDTPAPAETEPSAEPDDPESEGDAAETGASEQAPNPATPIEAFGPFRPAELPGTEPLSSALAEAGLDWPRWERTAARSEALSERGTGSDFAMQRLREDLVLWRDRFQQARGVNAARIATVEAQLAALGAPPEDGVEDEFVTERRAALTAQSLRLRAPVRLADEAYAHADGLIREIDRLIRERRSRALFSRGVSPLNPAFWPEAANVLFERLGALRAELWAGWISSERQDALRSVLAETLLLGLLGGVLMRAGRWVRLLRRRVLTANRRGSRALAFFVSLGQVALPFAGLLIIARALTIAGVDGRRAGTLLQSVPQAGLAVLTARWMAGQFFGPEAVQPIAGIAAARQSRARSELMVLGWTIAAMQVLTALISTADAPSGALAALSLPMQIVIAAPLFLLGRTLAGVTRDGAAQATLGADAPLVAELPRRDTTSLRQGLLSILGKVAMAVSITAPLLSLLGFAALSDALLIPAIETMFLIGVLVILQRLAFDVWTLATGSEDLARAALVPVLIGLVLILAALPVLALIWGARPEDLAEVWTRFREGYSFGETRLQPTDLFWLFVVFIVGYALTRMIQRALRSVVLPRTKLDLGGQNAVAVGFGYVGITTAAILAITSAGLDLSNLAIVAGALSVGIGFGLQNIVSNFVAGIILLIERPISEGDWIEVGGQSGYVRDISVRSTRIETFDKTDVIVPNADLVSNQVTNWTRGNSVGRVIVPVGVAHDSDLEKVQGILQDIADSHPLVLANPAAAVLFRSFGPSSLTFEIRAFLRDINFVVAVQSEMNLEIARRFRAAGIRIPYPQQDLWLRNFEAPWGGEATEPAES